MLMPSRRPPDDRGTRWLQAKTEQLVADRGVALAPPRFAGDSSCFWGTDLETTTTLYLRVAGDPEPKALRFNPYMIAGYGAGLYTMQHNAIQFIRRTLTKMGVLSTEHARD
jgi:hypothetical protein